MITGRPAAPRLDGRPATPTGCPVTDKSAHHPCSDLGGPTRIAGERLIVCHPSWPSQTKPAPVPSTGPDLSATVGPTSWRNALTGPSSWRGGGNGPVWMATGRDIWQRTTELSAAGDAALDAELVALGVGQHYPALPVGAPVVVDEGGAESDDPLYFRIPGLRSRIIGRQVEMDAVLDLFGFRHAHEKQVGGSVWGDKQALWIVRVVGVVWVLTEPRNLRPEPGQQVGVATVESDGPDPDGHAMAPCSRDAVRARSLGHPVAEARNPVVMIERLLPPEPPILAGHRLSHPAHHSQGFTRRPLPWRAADAWFALQAIPQMRFEVQ